MEPALLESLRTLPYLLSARVVEQLAAAGDDEVDEWLRPHVAFLRDSYKRHGQGERVYAVVDSLLKRLSPIAHRPLREVANLLALHSTLLLAVARRREHAEAAFESSMRAVEAAHRLATVRELRVEEFVAEYQMTAAVALKALGSTHETSELLGRFRSKSPSAEIAVPLERQEVLMQQDRRRFDGLLAQSSQYVNTRPREYYRTLKRAFEFACNEGATRKAESLVPELIAAFARIGPQVGLLEEVSLMKTIGHYLALTGQPARARTVLEATLLVADGAGFSGQARQIRGLVAAVVDYGPPRLSSFIVPG